MFGSPLVTGMNALVTCQVLTHLNDVNLSWNYVNSGHPNHTCTITSNQHLSTLTYKIKPSHSNTNCTCTGSFKEFHISAAVILDGNSQIIKTLEIASLKYRILYLLSITDKGITWLIVQYNSRFSNSRIWWIWNVLVVSSVSFHYLLMICHEDLNTFKSIEVMNSVS